MNWKEFFNTTTPGNQYYVSARGHWTLTGEYHIIILDSETYYVESQHDRSETCQISNVSTDSSVKVEIIWSEKEQKFNDDFQKALNE